MKKFFIISIFFIAILSLTAVSAENNATDQIEITDSPSVDEIVNVDENVDVLYENTSKKDWEMEISYPEELVIDTYDLSAKIYLFNNHEVKDSKIHFYADGIYQYDYSDRIEINPNSYTLGKHNFTFVFDGNDYYNPVNKTITIDIVYFTFKMSNYLKQYNDSSLITATAPQSATGTVEVYIDGKFYKSQNLTYNEDFYDIDYLDEPKTVITAINSQCFINLHNLEFKTYEIEVRYLGDEKYAPITKKVNVTFKYKIDDNIPDTVYVMKNRENITIYLESPKDITENISVIIDGKKYMSYFKNKFFGNNRFEVVIENLTIGKHDVTIEYPGDEDYPAYSRNKTFKISVKPNYSYFIINKENSITLQMPDDAVGNFSVYLKKDGKYTLLKSVNLVNGLGKIDLSFSKTGFYYLLMKYDTNYGSEEFNDPIEVYYSLFLNPSKLNIFYQDEGKLYVTVKDNFKDIPLKGLTVTAIIGKTTLKATTNKDGKVSFKIPKTLAPGDYKIKIKCKDTTTYVNGKINHILTLKTVKIKKSSKLVLQATLKNKKPLKNKKVTFKFNGKTFTAKTNSKGVAKVTIPKYIMKKLKVGKNRTYQAIYGKDVVKKTVKVLK